MLFNSIEFFIFLVVVFVLYWAKPIQKRFEFQNLLIVLASYVFYGWWDYRFLSLILFSTLIDFVIGKKMVEIQNKDKRTFLLFLSIMVNIGLLGFFKYYNFFLDSLYELNPELKSFLGFNTLDIILPVGISFYTFQTLSYTIDIYKGKLKPTNSFVTFAAFVSFFPQLVAGPIERAKNLLPQFQKHRAFDSKNATEGLRQILWGLFKKMVVADNCAEYANYIFNNSSELGGGILILGAVFFAFQIYGDFSGYSDIAIGTAKFFGFNLMKNFSCPYFSRDIAEFWRRWHISLSTWFRDYLYIPLGGSKLNTTKVIRNIFIIFLVSGLWHGANWTFLFWGGLNGLFFLPLLLLGKNRQNLGVVAENRALPNLGETWQMITTFFLVTFAWVFFRAESISHAFQYIKGIFTISESFFYPFPLLKTNADKLQIFHTILAIVFMLIMEWRSRKGDFGLAFNTLPSSKFVRYTLYISLFIAVLYLKGGQQEFIYFAF